MNKKLSMSDRGVALLLMLLALSLIACPAYAKDTGLDAQLKTIYKKAEQATKKRNIPESDFWLAKYMGVTANDDSTQHDYSDLFPLFELRKDLKATAFISGRYAPDFIEFFFTGSQALWGIPDEGIDEKKHEFIVRSTPDDHYFAEVVAVPKLEKWTTIKEKDMKTAVLPLGSNPVIVAGKLKNGEPVTFFPKIELDADHAVQFMWPIELYDLDGNGTPEVWIRYNAAWADGFSQELAIYKIKDGKELVLLKRFSGEAEGIARRLEGNRVEVGHGFTNKAVGHLLYDQHHLEIWEYQKDKFVKTSERDVPNILWTPSWTEYYFEAEKKQ